MDARVKAVRADEKVGNGSCSWIDECMSDEELIAWLDERGAKTPAAAVKAARRDHDDYEAVAADIRATAW